MPTVNAIIRTPTGVLASVTEPSIGTWLKEGVDPEGQDVPKSYLDAIGLHDYPRIGALAWAGFRDLCFRFVRWDANPNTPVDSTAEVAVVWIRYGPNLSLWDAWAPTQEVNGGIVDSDLRKPLVSLRTGQVAGSLLEVLALYKPDCVTYPGPAAHGGSSHSHNVMGVGFSSRDDGSELGVPGLHAICGRIQQVVARNPDGTFAGGHTLTYEVGPSLVVDRRRFQSVIGPDGPRPMTADDIIERRECDTQYPYNPEAPRFHPNVLDSGVITEAKPKAGKSHTSVGGTGSQSFGTPPAGPMLGLRRCASTDKYVWGLYANNRTHLWYQNRLPQGLQDLHRAMVADDLTELAFPKPLSVTTPKGGTGSPSYPSVPSRGYTPPTKYGGTKVGLLRQGYASSEAQGEALADMIVDTLKSDPEDVPLSVWNAVFDAILSTGFFVPTDDVEDGPAQDPQPEPELCDPEVEWIEEDGSSSPTPPACWDHDPNDPQAVKAAIDAQHDMECDRRFVLAEED